MEKAKLELLKQIAEEARISCSNEDWKKLWDKLYEIYPDSDMPKAMMMGGGLAALQYGWKPVCSCANVMARNGWLKCLVKGLTSRNIHPQQTADPATWGIDLLCPLCGDVVGGGGFGYCKIAGQTKSHSPVKMKAGRIEWSDGSVT